jgi:hypothetical protein
VRSWRFAVQDKSKQNHSYRIYEVNKKGLQSIVRLLACSFKGNSSWRVTRVTRMAYSPSLWLMAIGW